MNHADKPASRWKQIRVNVKQHQIEVLEEALLSLGALSITCLDAGDQPLLEPAPGETPLWDDCTLLALFDQDFSTKDIKSRLAHLTGETIAGEITAEDIEDEDWERAWLADFKPMFFGKQLWICPLALDPPDPSAINLRLDPGLAFGTGTHPTTALCLQWLDAHPPTGLSVLDFGCGSGVLAIAALLLGAKQATATDIDPQALQASRSNAENNRVSDRLVLTEPSRLSLEKVDIILANILSGTLIDLSDELLSRIKPNGTIILSGILDHQAQEVSEHYAQWFEMSPAVQQEEWICLIGHKQWQMDADAMKTECPNCGTIFNIVPSQMIRADKRVRCSACMTVFNSDICLVVENGLPQKKIRLEKPPFLQKLEPSPLPLPLQGIPKTHHSTKQASEEKSYYPVPVEEIDSNTDEIPEFLRNYDKENNKNGSRFILGAIACLALILLLGSRSIYVFKDVLSSDYKLRPYVQLFCQYTNCQLNPLRSIQSFKLVKRNIYSHPNQKGELIISAVFKNNAAFAQIYPKIRISMSDIQGNVVAQRIFSADEYLAMPDKQMSKGATATLSLNIIDPGHDALTFELEFI